MKSHAKFDVLMFRERDEMPRSPAARGVSIVGGVENKYPPGPPGYELFSSPQENLPRDSLVQRTIGTVFPSGRSARKPSLNMLLEDVPSSRGRSLFIFPFLPVV